jgi:hypothetical protein
MTPRPATPSQKQYATAMLSKSLLKEYLPTKNGFRHDRASVQEFTFIDVYGGYYRFQHIPTQNFLIVEMGSGKLIYPQNDKPFSKGYYDKE